MHFLPENRMCAPPFVTKQRPPIWKILDPPLVPETVFALFSGTVENTSSQVSLKAGFRLFSAGTTERRGIDSVSRQEEMFRGVQVSQVQTKVDERKQLGQHGTGMHQVSHQRLPTQTGKYMGH